MPELVANGPTIPVQLMNELDSGKVVFFCGAGVSAGRGSKLPSFECLVHHVYKVNRMQPDGAEREAWDLDERVAGRRRPNFDKVLGLLERPERLGAQALRSTVIERLSAQPTGPLDLHTALITLSRSEHGIRLVTTNFDNRFVDAGADEQLIDAAPKLPVPKPHNWSSLVHLHGRILQNDNGSNLVLTAADFGRAYLTERWAARFVTELFREFVVVFVGYSVGDPVMSYMVDALAAERAKGANFTMAYAFADYDGTGGGRTKARDGWLAKNVEPILYDNGCCHKLLNDTLVEWARIRNDPFHTRTQIVLNEMFKLPGGSNDPVVERVAWALQDPVAAQALADAPPVVKKDDFPKVERWLEMLSEKGLLRCAVVDARPEVGDQNSALVQLVDTGFQSQTLQALDTTRRYIAVWIARHLHVPQLLSWVIRNGGYLHPFLRKRVEISLTDSELSIPSKLRLLWTALLNNEPIEQLEPYWISGRYAKSTSIVERRCIESKVFESIAPRLVVRPRSAPRLLWKGLLGKKPTPIRPIDECGHLKLVVGDDNLWHGFKEILEDPAALSYHAEILTSHLNQAIVLLEYDDYNNTNSWFFREQIAVRDPDSNNADWTRLIDLVRDSYFALVDASPARGDNLLRRWVLSDHPLFKRLALHALAEDSKSDIHLARKLLVTGRKQGIWEPELMHEVLRFFKIAGARLPRNLKVEIVRAIHRGPKINSKNAMFYDAETVNHEKAIRLYKLSASGAWLDKKSRALAATVEPDIEDQSNVSDDHAGWIRGPRVIDMAEFAPKELLNGSVKDIAAALNSGEISNYGFQGLAMLRRIKIASALRRLSDKGKWPPKYWQSFLWSITGADKSPKFNIRLTKYIVWLLTNAPDNWFVEVNSAAAGFVRDLAEIFELDHEREFEVIWTKTWRGIGKSMPEIGDSGNSLTIAMNHAAGKLADAALARLGKYKPRAGEGIPLPIRFYFDTIVNDPNGALGRAMLTARLYSLFSVDRHWATNKLIPLLDLQSSREARDLWSAFDWSATVGPDLFRAFKDSFIEILRNREEDNRRRDGLTSLFVAICLEAPNELTVQEIHSVIESVSDEDLQTVLRSLTRRLVGTSTDRAKIWGDWVGVWLRAYWPRAEGRNTVGTSIAMLDLLVECGDAFNDAVAWSLPYLKSSEQQGLYTLSKNNCAERFPDSMLQLLNKIVMAAVVPVHQQHVLREVLDKIVSGKASLNADNRFQRLYRLAQ